VCVFDARVARPALRLTFCVTVLLATVASGLSPASARRLASTTNPAPRAIVPFTSFTFGDVYTGEVISQVFVIRNAGNAELLIKDFKGDCGCTVTRSDRIIPAGMEGAAELEVQTISQSGLINKTAVMHTNDPEHPVIIFTMIANVLQGAPQRQGKYIGPIFLSPGSQVAMFSPPGQKAATELLVTSSATPVNVLRVESGTKNFAGRVEVVEAGKIHRILVESLPIETGGMYRDQLRVITDNPTLPAFNVDVSLRVYPKQ
jgi:Protein of unknown function (DUF1573)